MFELPFVVIDDGHGHGYGYGHGYGRGWAWVDVINNILMGFRITFGSSEFVSEATARAFDVVSTSEGEFEATEKRVWQLYRAYETIGSKGM